MGTGAGTPRVVRRVGLAVLAAGVVGGAAVYALAAAEADSDDPVTRQRMMNQVERLGGRATVQTVEFDEWLSSLWHGERLGLTLGALGILLGGACWRVGVLMDEDD